MQMPEQYMQATLLPGWSKINLKQARIDKRTGKDFYLIHDVMKPKKPTKKSQEPEMELKPVKEHFICRNDCAKDIWLEKLEIACQYEIKTFNEDQ